MSKPPGTRATSDHTVKILIISPSNADHDALCEILENANAMTEAHCGWRVCPASSVESAEESLAEQEIPIVISECNLSPGTWQMVLEYISLLPVPPMLIVASRLADERLWAEALNLGAWDVLVKPFDRQEVIRVLASAWRHWQDRLGLPTKQDPAAVG